MTALLRGSSKVQAVRVGWAVPGRGDGPRRSHQPGCIHPGPGPGSGSEHGVGFRHILVSHERDIPYPVYSAAGNIWYR